MVSLAKPHLKWGRLRWSYSCPYICNVLYEFWTYFHMFLCSLNMYASVYVYWYWYCIIFYIVNEWRTGHLKTSSNLRKGGSSLALNLSSHKSWGAQLPFTEGRKQPRRCQIACEVCRELMSFQYQLLAGKWTTWMNISTNLPHMSNFPIFAKHIHKNIISMQWYIITIN